MVMTKTGWLPNAGASVHRIALLQRKLSQQLTCVGGSRLALQRLCLTVKQAWQLRGCTAMQLLGCAARSVLKPR